MAREITHRKDPETGNYVQIVSPERLREILGADGETHDPPSGFGPSDEWDVAEPTTTYEYQTSDGRTVCSEDNYPAILAAVAAHYGNEDIVIGHDGDLSEGGDRTLVWASEEDATDDAGERAIGSIRRA